MALAMIFALAVSVLLKTSRGLKPRQCRAVADAKRCFSALEDEPWIEARMRRVKPPTFSSCFSALEDEPWIEAAARLPRKPEPTSFQCS